MITAHGATLTVTNEALTLTPTALAASLQGSSVSREVAIADIRKTTSTPGDAWTRSRVDIDAGGGPLVVWFAPGDEEGPAELAKLLDDAKRGHAPATGTVAGGAGIPGFSFVGFDVETANPRWGSICQIGLVKIIDGEEVDRASWLCKPPAPLAQFEEGNVAVHGITADDVSDAPDVRDRIGEMVEFVGDLPLVAHNAQFDSTALLSGLLSAGAEVPTVPLACSLALSRDASKAEVISVRNHKLPTVAAHLSAPDFSHHDATEDARAAGEIIARSGVQKAQSALDSLMHVNLPDGLSLLIRTH